MSGKLLLFNEELDTNVAVSIPDVVPVAGLGTWLTAMVPDPDSKEKDPQRYEVEGQVIGIKILATLNLTTGQEEYLHIYTLNCPDFPDQPIDCLQEEIKFYDPSSNEFEAEYYGGTDEGDDEEQDTVANEADVLASQERAATGTSGADV